MKLHEQEMRAVYSQVLNELIEQNGNVMCLEADLSKATGTNPTVSSKHPNNFVDFGVSEANMICAAAGLACDGKIPFCASFCAFATRRVYDQSTLSVAYANTNVKIVGAGPGITQGANGGTHMCFQDLGIMRVMPNMQIFSPCDAYELKAIMQYMASQFGGMYLQLIRQKVNAVFDESYKFQPNRAVKIADGNDVTIITTGYMTHFGIKAVSELKDDGISAELLHCPSIKPFPEKDVIESAKKTKKVITVENQTIIGGLGSAVCETLSENYPVPIKRLGVPDKFGEVATEGYLLQKHGFGLESIKKACKELTGK